MSINAQLKTPASFKDTVTRGEWAVKAQRSTVKIFGEKEPFHSDIGQRAKRKEKPLHWSQDVVEKGAGSVSLLNALHILR